MAGMEASGDNFERLRTQFERRRQAQFAELARAMGEVDVRMFTESSSPGHGGGLPEFQLRGALPPTAGRRGRDVAAAAAISRGEKQAALELLARGREAERAASSAAAQLVREAAAAAARPRSARRASTGAAAASPASPAWEEQLGEFHRQAEFQRDEALLAEGRAEQSARRGAQREQVQRENFERRHKHREAAIVAESKRQRRRAEFDEYKSKVELQIEEAQRERQGEVDLARQQAQARRAKSLEKRAVANALRDFKLRHGMLDKTCRTMDALKIKAMLAETTRHKADRHREEQSMRSQQLEHQQLLCRAEQRARDEQDRNRLRFLLRSQRACDEQQVGEARQRIRAQHVFDLFLREARAELVEREGRDLAESHDMEAYQRTLAAFRSLADGVRQQSARLRSASTEQGAEEGSEGFAEGPAEEERRVSPLLPAEPRVREALLARPRGAEESVAETEDAFEEIFKGFSHEEDEEAAGAPSSAVLPVSGGPLGRAHVMPPHLPALPATVPPPPLQSAVTPVVLTPRELIAPLLTARAFRAPQAPAADGVGGRSRNDVQSFAALRMIRRTGPLIK